MEVAPNNTLLSVNKQTPDYHNSVEVYHPSKERASTLDILCDTNHANIDFDEIPKMNLELK